jgi:hypothetical protein
LEEGGFDIKDDLSSESFSINKIQLPAIGTQLIWSSTIKECPKDETSGCVSKNETSAYVSDSENTEIKEIIEFGNSMKK